LILGGVFLILSSIKRPRLAVAVPGDTSGDLGRAERTFMRDLTGRVTGVVTGSFGFTMVPLRAGVAGTTGLRPLTDSGGTIEDPADDEVPGAVEEQVTEEEPATEEGPATGTLTSIGQAA
jgi:hypothetical protein